MFLENPLFKAPDRRYRIMEISPELLFTCSLSPRWVSADEFMVNEIEGLPDDVQIQAIVYDDLTRLVCVRLWSSSWAVLEDGATIPKVIITIKSKEVSLSDVKAVRELCPIKINGKELKVDSIGFTPVPTLKNKMKAILEKPTRHIQFTNAAGNLCDRLNYEATDPKSLRIDGYYSCLECADRMTVLSLKECDRLDAVEKQITQDRETAFKSGKNPFEKPDWRK